MPLRKRLFEVPDTPLVRQGIFALIISALVCIPSIVAFKRVVPPVMLEAVPMPLPAASDREIDHGDAGKKQVIFTFDGGDGPQSAARILSVLAAHHVRGTFFLTGKFVEANPALVKEMAAAGDEIFSHTYDHPHLTQLSDAEITAEFSKMEDALEVVAGVSPKPYFRAPYGDRDARVIADAFRAGYQEVYWSIDAHDWEQPAGETAVQVHDQIMNNLAPGNIYLMHIGDTITGAILDRVFTEIEGKGYKIVSLTQGL